MGIAAVALSTWGWIFAFLFPLVGFIIGIVMAASEDRGATGVIVTSLIAGTLGVVILYGY